MRWLRSCLRLKQPKTDSFAANNLTRSEYAFVRLSQTLRQLFRELLVHLPQETGSDKSPHLQSIPGWFSKGTT